MVKRKPEPKFVGRSDNNKEVALSKLNVGVGEDFPVDSAETNPSDSSRDGECPYPEFRGMGRRFRRRRGFRGPFFFAAPLFLITIIALVSFAVSYPGIVLGLIAIAAVASMLRRHHRWHDDDDGPDDRRRDWRDRPDQGPQPDAPDAAPSARS